MMPASATSWVTRTVSAEMLPSAAHTDSSFSSRFEPAVGKPSSWLCARMCWPAETVGPQTARPPIWMATATAEGLMPPTSELSATPP